MLFMWMSHTLVAMATIVPNLWLLLDKFALVEEFLQLIWNVFGETVTDCKACSMT